MIWRGYAENKELKAKRAADCLEHKKLRSDYESYVHRTGRDYREARDTAELVFYRHHSDMQTLEARIADLEAALDLKSTLALTAQIRVDQLERAALGVEV